MTPVNKSSLSRPSPISQPPQDKPKLLDDSGRKACEQLERVLKFPPGEIETNQGGEVEKIYDSKTHRRYQIHFNQPAEAADHVQSLIRCEIFQSEKKAEDIFKFNARWNVWDQGIVQSLYQKQEFPPKSHREAGSIFVFLPPVKKGAPTKKSEQSLPKGKIR